MPRVYSDEITQEEVSNHVADFDSSTLSKAMLNQCWASVGDGGTTLI